MLMNQLIFRHSTRSRPFKLSAKAFSTGLPGCRVSGASSLKSPSTLLLNALNSLSDFAKLKKASLALFGIHLLHIGDQVFI